MSRRDSGARLSVTLAAALLVTSCSSVSEFVIVNATDKPIEVQYTFKEQFAVPACCPLGERPERKSAEDLRRGGAWTPAGEGEYVYDPSAARVTIVLWPAEALRVARLNNYAGHEEGEHPAYTLKSVRVEGERGAVVHAGLRAQTAFEEIDSGLYALIYR